MKIKWITWIVFFCLVWPVAEAYDFEKPASGGTYLSTDKGVKAVDRFPVPAGQTLDASAEQLAEKSAMVAPLTETFALHSNPSATKVIYLDFDGHYGLEGGGISYSPYNFEGPVEGYGTAFITQHWRAIDAEKTRGTMSGEARILGDDGTLVASPLRGTFRRMGSTAELFFTDCVSNGDMNFVKWDVNFADKSVEIAYFSLNT